MECQQQERDRDSAGLQLGGSSVDSGSLEETILWKETGAGLWAGNRQEHADCPGRLPPSAQDTRVRPTRTFGALSWVDSGPLKGGRKSW